MDPIAEQMAAIAWKFADKDPNALALLEERIAETGRNLELITYSDLVKGIVFHLPNIGDGKPYQITIYDWSGLDRLLIGDFLGYISTRSYAAHGFMASALVVSSTAYKPSEHFFQWMRDLQILPNTHEDTVLAFWASQVNKAHNWYRAHRKT
jgi:hypothetical protein